MQALLYFSRFCRGFRTIIFPTLRIQQTFGTNKIIKSSSFLARQTPNSGYCPGISYNKAWVLILQVCSSGRPGQHLHRLLWQKCHDQWRNKSVLRNRVPRLDGRETCWRKTFRSLCQEVSVFNGKHPQLLPRSGLCCVECYDHTLEIKNCIQS